MWAVERPDGGRGFGFTGGHFHDNWANDDVRKVVLNALVWVTKLDVPAGGATLDILVENCGRINYGRLMDNLPENRRQELIDLLAAGLGSTGTFPTSESKEPGTALRSLDFVSDQVRNQSRNSFLEGDCQNATNLLERRRLTMFKEVEERPDCCQPNVTGLWRVLAYVLQIL